nr:MAG TPA: hypothetical protein [Caudoviricetes sp.]
MTLSPISALRVCVGAFVETPDEVLWFVTTHTRAESRKLGVCRTRSSRTGSPERT